MIFEILSSMLLISLIISIFFKNNIKNVIIPPIQQENIHNKIDCKVSDWSDFSSCSAECGGGIKTRKRTILSGPLNGGAECPTLIETTSCNTDKCPIDCQVSDWTIFSECTQKCGGGTKTRSRIISEQPLNGGKECPDIISETINCNTHTCPIDCVVSEWTEYTKCSSEYDGGIKSRSRTIITPPVNGGKECPVLSENVICNTKLKPLDCVVSEWTNYSPCSAECGDGYQTRTRTIIKNEENGGKICPNVKEENKCKIKSCPIDCGLSEWQPWSTCANSCDIQTRNRTILVKSEFNGKSCGSLTDTQKCDVNLCDNYKNKYFKMIFTNCGATGNSGPTLDMCKINYKKYPWIFSVNNFSVNDGIQQIKIVSSGNYYLTMAGAKGGDYNKYKGGSSVLLNSYIFLNKDDVLYILIGQKGIDNSAKGTSAGGGGGTFLIINKSVGVIAGGGAGASPNKDGNSATTSNNVPDGIQAIDGDGNGNYGGSYNTSGNGGGGCNICGGGLNLAGKGFIQGGKGGISADGTSWGGFGGGGAGFINPSIITSSNGGGGGGGGYIGGLAGGGGGSGSDGSVRFGLIGINNDNGYIILNKIVTSYDVGDFFNFEFTENMEEFNILNATKINIECWGANGGSELTNRFMGGKGGYVNCDFTITSDLIKQKLYIFVGGKGETSIKGGWPNGGTGGTDANKKISASGGGGSSDVRTIANDTTTRIVVAGGGGGANSGNSGGDGGGLTGQNSLQKYQLGAYAQGGGNLNGFASTNTSWQGGASYGKYLGTSGTSTGIGGDGTSTNDSYGGGGGGGGWCGGGGGGADIPYGYGSGSGGGGGSGTFNISKFNNITPITIISGKNNNDNGNGKIRITILKINT